MNTEMTVIFIILLIISFTPNGLLQGPEKTQPLEVPLEANVRFYKSFLNKFQ